MPPSCRDAVWEAQSPTGVGRASLAGQWVGTHLRRQLGRGKVEPERAGRHAGGTGEWPQFSRHRGERAARGPGSRSSPRRVLALCR